MRFSLDAEDKKIMRRRAFVLFVAACLFSSVFATVFGGAGATAQTETTGADGECPEPSPSPTETESPLPDATLTPELPGTDDPEECDEEPDDDDNNNNGGNKGDDDDNNTPDRPDGDNDKGNGNNNDNDNKDGSKGDGSTKGTRKGGGDNDNDSKGGKDNGVDGSTTTAQPDGRFNATGEFDTDRLELIAAQLRARGLSEDEILERVYTPFLIGGPAAWTDTWGAPRYGPGPIVRTHEGQDVFCKYGDPVLATQDGEIEFDDGGLGGIVARLYAKDGSYFYYAHLSGWNTKDFESGDKVEAGDVIGFCGNSGNAITTPPHVHFGWYQANGDAKDPMSLLVEWLRAAERSAGEAYEDETGKSIDDLQAGGSTRLFGDGFAPDISELKVSSDALLAASSAAGGLGLADAALQAALSAQDGGDGYEDEVDVEAEGAGDEHSELAELLESESESVHAGGPAGD